MPRKQDLPKLQGLKGPSECQVCVTVTANSVPLNIKALSRNGSSTSLVQQTGDLEDNALPELPAFTGSQCRWCGGDASASLVPCVNNDRYGAECAFYVKVCVSLACTHCYSTKQYSIVGQHATQLRFCSMASMAWQ